MFENISTFEELRKAYHAASRKAHPDMGGSTEAMQKVNADFERATKRIESLNAHKGNSTHCEGKEATAESMAKYADVLQKVMSVDDITIEIVGSWIWATGETYLHREALKAAGMRYSSKHKAWYWHEDGETCKRSRKGDTLDDIKDRHGYETVRSARPQKLTTT